MSAPLGVVVENLDVKKISASLYLELNRLFCTHKVLVFPDQDLTPTDQQKFAEQWGELVPFPYGGLQDHPNIIELKNNNDNLDKKLLPNIPIILIKARLPQVKINR